ncbi:MAG: hypothetical protein QM698_15195 [Micropepsaceae bacterium]
MNDDRTTRIRAAAEPSEAGLDVWLPVLVAIAAAFFLLLSANAQTAAPRPIYDAQRFVMTEAERTALEEGAARLADAAAALEETRVRLVPGHVEMRALPALAAVQVATPRYTPSYTRTYTPPAARPVLISGAAGSDASAGWGRLVLAIMIAAMLGGALVMLDRTWRRTGPVLPLEKAAA